MSNGVYGEDFAYEDYSPADLDELEPMRAPLHEPAPFLAYSVDNIKAPSSNMTANQALHIREETPYYAGSYEVERMDTHWLILCIGSRRIFEQDILLPLLDCNFITGRTSGEIHTRNNECYKHVDSFEQLRGLRHTEKSHIYYRLLYDWDRVLCQDNRFNLGELFEVLRLANIEQQPDS